jgi:hypothetical protein
LGFRTEPETERKSICLQYPPPNGTPLLRTGSLQFGSWEFASEVLRVWVYQITKNGLAVQLTLQGTKYYKNDDLNKTNKS